MLIDSGKPCNHSVPHVCKSNAGYYIGIVCPNCGPWNRFSWYVGSQEEAEKILPLYLVEAPQQ